MCFHAQQTKSAKELALRFKSEFPGASNYQPGIYHAFDFPATPIITNEQPQQIQLFQWGLIPAWAPNQDLRKLTLNARIETIHEKPSFKDCVAQRCLILADGFFEWKWLDGWGKSKQKYALSLPDMEVFAFAGLWSEWRLPETNQKIHSYTLLTTEAEGLMREIHNSKKRMPIILNREGEQAWLKEGQLILQNNRLQARKMASEGARKLPDLFD